MAKFRAILSVMDDMNPRYIDRNTAQQRGRIFRVFLRENHKILHNLIYVPLAIMIVYCGFVALTFFTTPKVANVLAPSCAVVFLACGLSICVCQFLGVSKYIDSGKMNSKDWEDA